MYLGAGEQSRPGPGAGAGEAAAEEGEDSFLRRAAAAAGGHVRAAQVPQRGGARRPRQEAGPLRHPGQDMVPEQTVSKSVILRGL